jgi:hypothetical protein
MFRNMNPLIFWIRLGLFFSWFFAPPILVLVSAIRAWRNTGPVKGRILGWPFAIGIAAIANWLVFFVYMFYFADRWIDGAAVLAYRMSIVLLPLALLCLIGSISAPTTRASLTLANFVLATLWFTFGYAPQHWLSRVEIDPVRVGEQQVLAVAYFGNPRQSEAEAIALVHVPNVGDYYFDFGHERFRQASDWDFVRLHYGAWSLARMTQGRWRDPLPSLRMNECRLPLQDGRVLTIPF